MFDQKEAKKVEEQYEMKEVNDFNEESQKDEEQEDDLYSINSSISLFQIILATLALFLVINGPTNYYSLWNQLTNPPVDARHAIRNGNSGNIPVSPQIIPHQTIQLKEYALGMQQSLKTNVANADNRIALINRMFGDLSLDKKKSGEVNIKLNKNFWFEYQNIKKFIQINFPFFLNFYRWRSYLLV
jgi:hypothetical protein